MGNIHLLHMFAELQNTSFRENKKENDKKARVIERSEAVSNFEKNRHSMSYNIFHLDLYFRMRVFFYALSNRYNKFTDYAI